jgi:DNA-binding MarR family transcriptional regulator
MTSPAPSADLDVRLSGCTCSRLRRLTRRVTAVYDHALAAVGLRVTQFSLLAHLRGHPGLAMTDLAGRLDMDRTTLTRNLAPLIAAGWVEVAPSPDDARRRLVRITASGEDTWRAARTHWRRAQQEVRSTMGDESLAMLHRLVDDALPLFRPAVAAGDHE